MGKDLLLPIYSALHRPVLLNKLNYIFLRHDVKMFLLDFSQHS
jgi:hypothetical protein